MVLARGGHQATIVVEADRPHARGMSLQSPRHRVGVEVYELDVFVVPRANQHGAVRGPTQASNAFKPVLNI
eukprot:2357212-Rhodomonas_salina.2